MRTARTGSRSRFRLARGTEQDALKCSNAPAQSGSGRTVGEHTSQYILQPQDGRRGGCCTCTSLRSSDCRARFCSRAGRATDRLRRTGAEEGREEKREPPRMVPAFEPEQRLVAAEAGDGTAVPYGEGNVTPYTGLSWAGKGVRTHRVGALWNIAPEAVLGLEGVHERGNAGEAGSVRSCSARRRGGSRTTRLNRIHRRRRSRPEVPAR